MIKVHTIPAFNDNYFWLIQPDDQHPDVYVVDPGSAGPVTAFLQVHALTLCGILITHHHHDHIGGANELRDSHNIPIYGPSSAKIPQVTDMVNEGDAIFLGSQSGHCVTAKILNLAGHTLDHIGYFIKTIRTSYTTRV